jgi:nicotinamide-nucleotide amidase
MRGHATRTETVEFGPLGRENIRQAATSHALALIAAALS